jgi:hypothetical protein
VHGWGRLRVMEGYCEGQLANYTLIKILKTACIFDLSVLYFNQMERSIYHSKGGIIYE